MLALGCIVAAVLFLNLGLRSQIIATVAMLVGYWALLAFVPDPGHEIGKFREGCNAGDWVTGWMFGKWRDRHVGWVIGILGHASTAMLGVFAGQLLRSGLDAWQKLRWLAVLGVGCIVAGVLWSGWIAEWFPGAWSQWPVWFPIIEVRWTSSCVLYAGGISVLLLALCCLIIDVWGWRRWAAPFMAISANDPAVPITVVTPPDLFFHTVRKVRQVHRALDAEKAFEARVMTGGHSWDAPRNVALGDFLARRFGLKRSVGREDERELLLSEKDRCVDAWPAAITTDQLAEQLTGRRANDGVRLWDVFPPSVPRDVPLEDIAQRGSTRQILAKFEAFLLQSEPQP